MFFRHSPLTLPVVFQKFVQFSKSWIRHFILPMWQHIFLGKTPARRRGFNYLYRPIWLIGTMKTTIPIRSLHIFSIYIK